MGLEVGNKGAGLRGRGWLKVVGAVRKLCGDREQGNEIKDGCQNKEAPDDGHCAPGVLKEPGGLLGQVDVDHLEGDFLLEKRQHGALGEGTIPGNLVRVRSL